jgi:LacI family transcriptional regulator
VQLIDLLEPLGVRVPDDVSVVGFDGTDLGAHSRIGLTTVAQPRAELIAHGLDLLLERMGDGSGPPRHVRLAPRLVVRASTAVAP